MVAESLIERGLAARQHRGGPFSSGLVVTHQSIEAIRGSFDQAHTRHASALRSITKSLAEFDDGAAKRIAKHRTLPDGHVRPADERQRFASEIKRERGEFLRALFKSLARDLDDSRREMLQTADAVRRGRDMLSAIRIATSSNLGSERRGRLLAELASAGPATLLSLARQAHGEQDAELASVLIGLNDKLAPKDRPFSSGELAESVFGSRAANALQHADFVSRECDAAIMAERAVENGATDSLSRIEHALAVRGDAA